MKIKILKRFIVYSLFITAAFFFGAGISYLIHHQKEAPTMKVQESTNWGLGFNTDGKPPTGTVTADELKRYDAYYLGNPKEKKLYLTFDAGYENGNTPAILDALKKHKVKATFFVVGNFVESNPDLVKKIVEDGHTVGNHTWHHRNMSSMSTMEEFKSEMEGLEKLYEQATGQKITKFYRPPQGIYSEENLQMAKDLGYHTFFWSLAYVDWYQNDQPTKEEAFQKLLTRVHPGAIVLLHSTSSTNASILDELLSKWEDMGYTFGTLNDLAGVPSSSKTSTSPTKAPVTVSFEPDSKK